MLVFQPIGGVISWSNLLYEIADLGGDQFSLLEVLFRRSLQVV